MLCVTWEIGESPSLWDAMASGSLLRPCHFVAYVTVRAADALDWLPFLALSAEATVTDDHLHVTVTYVSPAFAELVPAECLSKLRIIDLYVALRQHLGAFLLARGLYADLAQRCLAEDVGEYLTRPGPGSTVGMLET